MQKGGEKTYLTVTCVSIKSNVFRYLLLQAVVFFALSTLSRTLKTRYNFSVIRKTTICTP